MAMTEVETELDSRYDDIDVDSILARCQKGPITYSKRCLYQAPQFVKRLPSTEEVEEGSTVSFGCKVVGFPNPTVTWYKDDDVIKPEARAKVDADDSGLHSIKIADISKCDAGIYKIRASNLEGSSTSMLYIAVKARSKLRNRKKAKRARLVACPPLFPAIIEHVAEEQKEMMEVELQPESPLTPIYCTISRKEPVMWPAFLGDWAYNADDILHRDEIDETEDVEDVFDDDDTTSTSLTFVSTAYAQMMDDSVKGDIDNVHSTILNAKQDDTPAELEQDSRKDVHEKYSVDHKEDINNTSNAKVNNELTTYIQDNNPDITSPKDTHCDKINNNDKDNYFDKYTDENMKNTDNFPRSQSSADSNQFCQNHCYHQTEVKQGFIDPETVSVISVHRSYAKGDSTSSVARRSPSPLSRSRIPMTFKKNGRHCDINEFSDTTTLQNINNERILMKMNQQVPLSRKCFMYFRSLASANTWEDHLIEILVLICGSTFLALCFDLPPTTFIADILLAMFIKLVLTEVFNDS